ncbi:MAG: glycosyltransferase family 4 protein [Actinomycetota bacterium]|nr:glycosyltransferase family 4 protein [Actinomycetota bacterium]
MNIKKDYSISVLFIVPYPVEEPVTRFRVVQYFNYFEESKILPKIRPFFSARLFKIKNKHGVLKTIEKLFLFAWACFRRFLDLLIVGRYDVVYISKEAFPLGPPFIERIIKILNPNIIFDFDDAIFAYAKDEWRNIWIDKNRVAKIIKMSSFVIVGNQYLANFAYKYNKNVKVILTPIDVKKYKPLYKKNHKNIIIGWIGTWSNVKYLYMLKNVFEILSKKYNFTLKIVGPDNIFNIKFNGVKIEYKLWSLNDEVKDLQSFDIGIMPLENTEWEKGKCGFKIIQYMSVGIPSIASPVGINKKIIKNYENGFLAEKESEWIEKLSFLIEDSKLRNNIGLKARKLAEKYYSVSVVAPKLVKVIKSVGGN